MAKKKVKGPKPFCWYCEREFDDDAVLIQHQKSKHFKCPHCPKRLITTSGLRVHVSQVHKVELEAVPNALPDRDSVHIEIFGMAGVPAEAVRARQAKVLEQREQDERARHEKIANKVKQQKLLASIVATLKTSQNHQHARLPYPRVKLSFARIERELNEQNLRRNLQSFVKSKDSPFSTSMSPPFMPFVQPSGGMPVIPPHSKIAVESSSVPGT